MTKAANFHPQPPIKNLFLPCEFWDRRFLDRDRTASGKSAETIGQRFAVAATTTFIARTMRLPGSTGQKLRNTPTYIAL
jgi:hypothetical protein